MRLPRAAYSWTRVKLNLAELLVISTAKGDHSFGYRDRVQEAAAAIREYREMYYPSPCSSNLDTVRRK